MTTGKLSIKLEPQREPPDLDATNALRAKLARAGSDIRRYLDDPRRCPGADLFGDRIVGIVDLGMKIGPPWVGAVLAWNTFAAEKARREERTDFEPTLPGMPLPERIVGRAFGLLWIPYPVRPKLGDGELHEWREINSPDALDDEDDPLIACYRPGVRRGLDQIRIEGDREWLTANSVDRIGPLTFIGFVRNGSWVATVIEFGPKPKVED